jgi:ribosomal protein S18 acetylase RimI-like enzyme
MREILEERHYRSVKALFKETFLPPSFTLNSINTSWYHRCKEESYAFLDDNGKFIGFIITSYHKRNKGNLYVDYIALDPHCRGNGLGTAIIHELLQEIKSQRRSIHLYPENHRLHAWYERLGFYKTQDGYYNFHSYNNRSRITQ